MLYQIKINAIFNENCFHKISHMLQSRILSLDNTIVLVKT